MSGTTDSAEGSATPASMTGASGSTGLAASMDNQYEKATRKGELKVDKLTSDNYLDWADNMQVFLEAKEMWRLVIGKEKIPPVTRPNDRKEWLKDDAVAKAWIHANVENLQHTHIRGLATSHERWMALKKVHEAAGQGRLSLLKQRFHNYKAGPNETVDEVVGALTRLQQMMANIKERESPTDMDLALRLIASVDEEAYALTKYNLEEMEDLTSVHAIERLKLVEQKMKDEQAIEETANQARGGRSGKKDKETRECYYCEKKGHLKTRCFKWLATNEGKEYLKKKADESDQLDTPEPKSPNQKEKKGSGKTSDRPIGSARTAKEKKSDDSVDPDDSDEAWMAIDGLINRSSQGWVLDSGATRHMTPDESIFVTIRWINTSVTVVSGEMLKAQAIGEVRFDLGGQIINMKNVLLVPGLDANLLSISALNRRGFNVMFSKKGVEIRKGDTLVATGVMRDRMYLLRSANVALYINEVEKPAPVSGESVEAISRAPIGPENSEKIPQPSDQKGDAFRLWHERLGHVSPARMRLLTGQVTGMGAMKLHDQLTCDICDLTKLTRKINREPPKRASRRLGRVHTDVWGPFRIPSISGSRYFLSLIDDLTRKSWIFFLRTRNEIHRKIEDWRAEIRLEIGEEAAIFRSNNAKEYRKFEEAVRSQGIKVEFTTAYTPEENGVAERFNRTVIQMARAMLLWAELPQKFWGEAASTANYLRNMMPAGIDKEKSPNELWTGSKPDVSHIRKFGCLCFVHIPKENRNKLDAVALKGIFVGYHSSTQVRVFNPETGKINWHTAVSFREDSPGGRLLESRREEEKEEVLIFSEDSEDDEDEKTRNIAPEQIAPEQDAHGGTELVGDESTSTTNHQNHENHESQVTPTNQTARKTGRREIPAQPTRRSARLTKPYKPYDFDNQFGRTAISDLPTDQKFEPSTYREAVTCPDQRLWKTAITEQLNALIANQTWELVDRPSDVENIITSKWVFKVKYTQTGHIDRYKARLVARGFSQVHGIDFEETFSPTLRLESLRMLLAFSAHFGYEIEQMDVPDAYLKGDLKETIYMEIPEGYATPASQSNGQQVLKLLRPLYGLKQSGREWNLKAKNQLGSMGFRPISSDSCVFLNKSEQTILALYVDDMLIFSQSAEKVNIVKQQLFEKFSMKDMGKASFVLGIRIRRNIAKGLLAIDQTTYIRKFLHEYGMKDTHPVSTPIDGHHALTPSDSSEPRTDQREYQKRIDSLMYAMVATRPDIAYAVGKLSQYCQDPAQRHRTALDRIFRYLRRTADLTLIYDRTARPICYADASYGDDVSDRKSTYGNALLIGNGAVTWASKKQRTVASSTTEAEYVSMCQASKNIVWATRWINELRLEEVLNNSPIQLLGDNQGALDLIKNPEHHSRTKHIDVQYHYVRQVAGDGLIKPSYVPTSDMIADILTKPTKPPIFLHLREKLGLTKADL